MSITCLKTFVRDYSYVIPTFWMTGLIFVIVSPVMSIHFTHNKTDIPAKMKPSDILHWENGSKVSLDNTFLLSEGHCELVFPVIFINRGKKNKVESSIFG